MVKQGDKVRVDEKEARVETTWAECNHHVYKLDDGRIVRDLEKLIERGVASIVREPTIRKVYDRKLGTPLPEPDDEE